MARRRRKSSYERSKRRSYSRDYSYSRVTRPVYSIPLIRNIVVSRNVRPRVLRAVTPPRVKLRKKRIVVSPMYCDRERRNIRRAYFAAGRPRGRGGVHNNRFTLTNICRRK